jgi:NAD(P)-dependent dehydrogenase (short-subunit alcohol dehydrogenase family)
MDGQSAIHDAVARAAGQETDPMPDDQPVLLLTGASRGIGHATVKTFSDKGWRVLTVSRHAFDPRCPWRGGERNHIQLDLADIDAVHAALPRIRDIAGGRLDALINNAAISPKTAAGGKIGSLALAYRDWLHIFNVNFFAAVMLTQGLTPLLTQSRGAVVNITSIVGSRVHPFASAAYAT